MPLFFDETERTLFCSDLSLQPGDPEPLEESDSVGPAREAITASLAGPLANDLPYMPYTDATIQRLADLAPATLGVWVQLPASVHNPRSLAVSTMWLGQTRSEWRVTVDYARDGARTHPRPGERDEVLRRRCAP